MTFISPTDNSAQNKHTKVTRCSVGKLQMAQSINTTNQIFKHKTQRNERISLGIKDRLIILFPCGLYSDRCYEKISHVFEILPFMQKNSGTTNTCTCQLVHAKSGNIILKPESIDTMDYTHVSSIEPSIVIPTKSLLQIELSGQNNAETSSSHTDCVIT